MSEFLHILQFSHFLKILFHKFKVFLFDYPVPYLLPCTQTVCHGVPCPQPFQVSIHTRIIGEAKGTSLSRCYVPCGHLQKIVYPSWLRQTDPVAIRSCICTMPLVVLNQLLQTKLEWGQHSVVLVLNFAVRICNPGKRGQLSNTRCQVP